jgi:hypothetical protein
VLQSSAQNLVPNPSFEDTLRCPSTPSGLASLSDSPPWTQASDGSPDLFHECHTGFAGVPSNAFGGQTARSGKAYAGFAPYDPDSTWSYREYIEAPLLSPLQAGTQYWVTFYVSRAGTTDYAIKEIGAHFSNGYHYSNIDSTLSLIPQIENSGGVLIDSSSWVKISESFIATGGEDHIIIGNFNRSQFTTSVQVKSENIDYSYYYIDDICVSSDSLECFNTVGIKELNNNKEKTLIRIVDIMGRETEDRPNALLIFIYSDGTTEKIFRVE